MFRARANAFVAFLRSPAVLCITLVITLFLQLFASWDLTPDVFGHMYLFIRAVFWFCVLTGLALLVHYGFDRLTDWLARPEEPGTGKNTAEPAALIRR